VWLLAGAAAVAGVLVYALLVALPTDLAARAAANARAVLAVEAALDLDVERAIQSSPLGRGRLGAALAVFYAAAYWPFVVVGTAVTAWRDRPAFRLTRNALLVSGAVGLIVIAAFPVAPPRLLDGYDDHVGRLAVLGSVAHPDGLFNPYAAMPSFHVAWMVVVALGLRNQIGRPWRWAPPALMALAVVTTGNHYVLDVAAGIVLASLAWLLATPMQRAFEQARISSTGARPTRPGRLRRAEGAPLGVRPAARRRA
jgi:membrane-associated phospholipid phosphatase